MNLQGSSATTRLPDAAFWQDRRVLVTGHTGFKGSWLCRWLTLLGAEVHGIALDPPDPRGIFVAADIGTSLSQDTRADIRNSEALRHAVDSSRASVIFHLAAQPLVRASYREPAETIATNVTGTANLLDCLRRTDTAHVPDAVVIVTSDKVYAPTSGRSHRESDPLGGYDPYSVSKSMVEELVAAFRRLPPIDGLPAWTIPIATARAGNVIGGGDWARDRLVPDCVRAVTRGKPVTLRYPDAIRPWQHVLDPLNGYLLLAEELVTDGDSAPPALNFGPGPDSLATVGDIVAIVASAWGASNQFAESPRDESAAPETLVLRLDSELAARHLGWATRWPVATAIDHTVSWYRQMFDGRPMPDVTDDQIRMFSNEA